MEERFAVTAATGALGPVLVKLAALLGDEYKLQEGTRRGIESIKSELEPVHDLLGKLWGRLDLDVACKDWIAEARELSYDMEDGIDGFTPGLERGGGSFIQREATDSPFKELMERVKGVSKRCGEMQKIGDTSCNSSKLTTDPRALFLHKDASELVGMEEKKKELIRLLQKHKMVCIVGFAGMGKTTLADLVYQTIGDEFQCRAFVSVHPSPNMTEILGTILSQVTDGAMSACSGTEPAAEQNMATDISISLSEKRYMVIIDDIWHWEDWEVIRKALPKNNLGSKLIMTTRVWNIAKKCQTEQGAVVHEQKFDYEEAARLAAMRLSKSAEGTNAKIADMCGEPPFDFCPLAVTCLSSAWAESHEQQGGDGEWHTWASHVLYDAFLSTPSLKPLVRSLCLGFDDLPIQLRTCLLYCTVNPLGYLIDRGCLVRKCIAEGFVSEVEVAETYFDKLVSRNLLQRVMGMHAVHPIMGAFLVCKAKEDNFIAYDGPGNSSQAKPIRRLSLTTGCHPYEDVLSHIRSLVFSGYQCQLDGVPFKAFKKLRVLEIKSSRLENGHLVDICWLIRLKYLKLHSCDQITRLPSEIGRLQNLESLHVAGTHICKLPWEITNLERLETLDVGGTEITELPTWIGKLQSLKTLNVSRTKLTELPWKITNLERLETLDVGGTKVTELPTWIEKLQSLKTLKVSGTKVAELPWEITNLERLETLDVGGTEVTELPTWIEKLQSLRTLNLSRTKVTELPWEIKNLERLETLDISRTWVRELPKEIGKLQQLRTLDIRGTKVRELSCREIPNCFLSVVGHFDSSSGRVVELPLGVFSSSGDEEVISSPGANCRQGLSILVLFNHFYDRCEVLPVPMHRVAGRHMSVPQWVKQDLNNIYSLDISLYKLGEDDLKFVKNMPNLQVLALRFEVLPRQLISITGGGFSKLETFYVDCRLPQVAFQRGAVPNLKHLEFKFYSGLACQDYSMGITHLPKLEKVVFRCSEYYTSDNPGVRATIEVVRKEAAEHPNEITLYVNYMIPEVFGSGGTWISLADKAIIEKEFEEWEKEIEERERKIDERWERILEQRLELWKAAQGRAQRYKNIAKARIVKEIQERKSDLENRERALREAERDLNI